MRYHRNGDPGHSTGSATGGRLRPPVAPEDPSRTGRPSRPQPRRARRTGRRRVTTAVVYTLVPLVAVAASVLVWQGGGSSAALRLGGWSSSIGNGHGYGRNDPAGGPHHTSGHRTSSPTPTSSG